jgi:hypothetical protein
LSLSMKHSSLVVGWPDSNYVDDVQDLCFRYLLLSFIAEDLMEALCLFRDLKPVLHLKLLE